MGKYDRENLDIYSNLLDEIKQNFNLDNEGAETALLLIRERALSLELSLSEYMRTYHPQGFSEKDNSLNDEYKGYIKFIGEDAASIIKTGKTADFSTFTHEIAHGFRRQLSGELKETAENAFKVENGQWTELQEEAFAVGFEEYIRLRLTENEELEKVFEKGSLYMQRVYNGLDRIIELNPEIIKVYDQMFTHGRFQFNQEGFDKTIDNIANFKDETSKFSSSHVYLGMTPPIYQELGFERLPVMITAKHLQNIMAENGKSANINYHGITPDMIKQIPEAIKKPLIVMQSQNKGNEEDIIAVIGLKDKKGKQIIIPFSPNKKGYFNDLEIDINLAKTIYGRTGFNDFLMRSIKEDRILYVNEKSRELTIPEIQFLRNHKSQLLYNNIAEYHKAVKGKNPGFNILYQKQAYYSGGQFEFDFLNDPEKKKKQKVQERLIQAQNDDKLSVNTENKQNTGIIVQTDKIKILNNTEMERVQLFFPKAPDVEIRNDLKSHGWRWSPRNFCWQRLNTENGLNDAMRIFDKWYKENEKIILTKEDYDNAQKIIPPLQYKTTLSYSKYSEDADFFKEKIKEISSIYQNAPALYKGKGKGENGQTPLLFRYFHPSGTEQYICEIDKEEGLVYSFGILNGELHFAEWGYQRLQDITSIKNMEMDYHIPEGMTVERMLYNKYPHHFPDPDKPTAKNKEKDYNETEQNKEKQKVEEKFPVAEKHEMPLIQKDRHPPVQEVDWYQAFAGSWNTFYPNGTDFKPYIEGYYKNSENLTIKYYNRGVSKTDFSALLEGVNDVVFNAEHLGQKATDNFLKRFKNYGFYPQKQYTNERGERAFILMIRDGSKSGNVEMITDRKDKRLQYTILTKDDDGTILEKKIFDKSDNAQAYMDFKRRKLNGGKEYEGNTDRGIQNRERNRNTGNGGEWNKDEGRNTGLDDSGLKQGRTEAIGRSIDESSRDEIPESLQDGQRERSKVGNSHEPQNGQRNNAAEYQVIPNQPRNGLIDDEKKSLKEVKSIREKCLNLLNSKEDHEFTQEDKKFLLQYEGGGGTGEENRSTSGVLYEFYTPNSVVNKVWELVDSYAPNAKTVLEPSGGTGRFIHERDKNECTLIELDKTSSRIASILHPNAEVKNQAFQELFFKDGVIHKENYEGKKYDVVIGNPPYGDYTGIYKGKGEGKKHSRYEQYFIERGLDTLKENGILAFVLPSSFLSNGESEGKRLIASKGELIDAWRLPAGVFNTTDVGTDVVIIKKGQGNIRDFCSDTFFSLNPDHILGEEKEVSGRFGKPEKKIIPFNEYSTQETLNLIVPQKNISFTAIENITVSKAKEKTENPIKNENSRKAKEVENNVAQSSLLSASEFSLKYGNEIDKREFPIWKLTDYEGKINESAMTKEDIDFISKNPNYVKIDSSSWMHIVNYTKGNVYEKLDELEKEAHKIDFQVYLKRKKILQNAIPQKIPYEKINISVHSSIAQEFIVEKNPDGTDVNLQEGFIKWATGEKEQAQAQANNLKNYTTTYYIDYEYSPLNQNDMPENIGWYDIISFINKEPVRARAADGVEEKKAAQIEAQKKRNTRRDTAELLFNRYIQEGVPQHLKDELCDMWNRRFNGYVNPDYTKFPLFVEGMNRFKNGEEFTLYNQQIKGVSFLSNKGNGLLAYDVGVGKTACGIVFNVNQIQSERAKRPLICIPKSVYSKWVKDIKELFPNIKVNELGNFSKDVLKPFAADDHGLNIPEKSISVCTIEALQKITFLQETIDNEIAADLLDARLNLTGNARTDAQDKERVYEILGGATQAKDEDYIFWEKTGFDSITVDEAHRFKNLFTVPRAVKEDEKQAANEFEGIGSGVPSKRAQKLFAITQLIQKENDGRNVCLLTATPFTNSPTEVYSMLSYVARQKLKDMHIYNLSAFLTEFAETKTEWVVKPKGDIQPKQIMKNFKNLKSLQNLLTEYIDKVDAEEAGVIRPKKIPHVVELKMNDTQKMIIEAETERIQNASKDDPGAVLVAMNNMRIALLSPALVNPVYDFDIPLASQIVESSPKLTFVCDSIIESYKKEPQGGQVMYMPRGITEFSHVKNYLVSHGIPKDAIALVSSSTTNAQKDKITEDFNDKNKKLKIIIGSETISEGIDLNGNSFALYNTMLGWNPTESIQVEGRIWRQGNEQGHVHIVYPVMYDSIDSLMLQKHDEKSSRIKDLWSYKGDKLNVEHIHPEELKFDLIKDPIKKADFLIEQRVSSFKRDISIINMKIKSIDQIIEKRKEYKEQLTYYEVRNDKKKLTFFKNRLASLDKKCKSFGITSETEQYTVIAKLNKDKQELDVKIDVIKNEKDDFIKKFIAEAEKSQKTLLPIPEIIKNNCNKILNDLCPMEKLKEEYKLKNNQVNTVNKITNIDRSKAGILKRETVPLKTYKQAPFEFMVAEKKSDFFGVKSSPNNKKEAVCFNTKAPIHKKIENSIER